MDGYKFAPGHRPTDWLFWSYNAIVVIFLILMGNRVEFRWWYLCSNLILIVASVFIIRMATQRPHNRIIRFLRHWYPFGYFFYLHWESGMIGLLFFEHRLDPIVAGWDLAIFGDYLHNILYQFQPLWFSEFIHFTYFFYYILMIMPALILYLRNEELRFRNYLFELSLLYLIHYTIFYMFPVEGPIDLHLERFPDGLIFIPMMKIFYHIGDSPGGAMPSSHVSVAILSWWWMLHIRRRWMPLLTFLTICLIFSTVYLSYHYAIDSVAGFLVGSVFVFVMSLLKKRYGRENFI